MSKTIRVEAGEMLDADVEFISLVPRGANRAPFKVLKSEEKGMKHVLGLDLTKVLSRAKKADTRPEMVAVAVVKGEGEAMKAVLEAAGIPVTSIIVDDEQGADILALKEDTDFADVVAFKLQEGLVAVVANVTKSVKKMALWADTSDFGTNMAQMGFMPTARLATDVLLETLWNIVASNQDAASMKTRIQAALADFSAYVADLAVTLPETVFKLESIVAKKTAGTDSEEVNNVTAQERHEAKLREAAALAAGQAAPATPAEPAAPAGTETGAQGGEGGDNAGTQAGGEGDEGGQPEGGDAGGAPVAGAEGDAGTANAGAADPGAGSPEAGAEGGAPAGGESTVQKAAAIGGVNPEDLLTALAAQFKSVFEPLGIQVGELAHKIETIELRIKEKEQADAQVTTELTQKTENLSSAIRGTLVGGAAPAVETQPRVVKQEGARPIELPRGVHLECH